MKSLSKDYYIEIVKSFDGYQNFLNMSGRDSNYLIRRENLLQDDRTNFILSSIVNQNNKIILEGYRDNLFLHSYEDPRYITKQKFTYSLAYFDNNTEIMGMKMGYCNSIGIKKPELYNLKKYDYEKNWQITRKNIIYSIEPLEIYKKNYDISIKAKSNKKWNVWIKKFGIPRLSTNTFNIKNKIYTIFHSKIFKEIIKDYSKLSGLAGKLQYFCGLLEVDKHYHPVAYYTTPIFPSFNNFNTEIRSEYVNWRAKTNSTWEVDVLFPMNIEEDKDNLKIYCGINDCIASIVTVSKKEILKSINKNNKVNLI